MVYLCDQESSVNAAIQASCKAPNGDATWEGAIPKNSAVGERHRIGRAEQAVQVVEDQMKALKCALEDRIGARIPSTHPIMMWMAEYVGVLLCKYTVGPDGPMHLNASMCVG